MPRRDRESSREGLRLELLDCGFSAEEADRTVCWKFSGKHLTSLDVFRMSEVVREVRQKFRSERQRLENALEAEKKARQGLIDGMKALVSQCEDGDTNADVADFDAWLQTLQSQSGKSNADGVAVKQHHYKLKEVSYTLNR
jgi:hypothetical protein